MKNGAFSGSDWHLLDSVCSSRAHRTRAGPASCTRTRSAATRSMTRSQQGRGRQPRHPRPRPSYILPSIAEFTNFEFDYLKAFDYRANGYAVWRPARTARHLREPGRLARQPLLPARRTRLETASDASQLTSSSMTSLGHMQKAEDVQRAFAVLSDQHRASSATITRVAASTSRCCRTTGWTSSMCKTTASSLSPTGSRRSVSNSVETLNGHDPKAELYAIPISARAAWPYLALHTHPDLLQEISGRITGLPSVDLAVHKLKTPAKDPKAPNPLDWYAIWGEGGWSAYFGFDPASRSSTTCPPWAKTTPLRLQPHLRRGR